MGDATTTGSDVQLRAGAECFRGLLESIHMEAERQLGEHIEELDADATLEFRDYARLAQVIEFLVPLHGDEAREGFMRALADVLCQFADGCNFASGDGGDTPSRIGGVKISGSAAALAQDRRPVTHVVQQARSHLHVAWSAPVGLGP